jgi:hypothetical protein
MFELVTTGAASIGKTVTALVTESLQPSAVVTNNFTL